MKKVSYFDLQSLASAISIQSAASQGTGFVIYNELYVFIVTAKHVIYNDDQSFRATEVSIFIQSQKFGDNSKKNYVINLDKAKIEAGKGYDVVVIYFARVRISYDENLDLAPGIALLEENDLRIVAIKENRLLPLHEVQVGSDIFILGYPISIGLKRTAQFDYNKPLLRKGIIANLHLAEENIILDCSVYPGNSGAPVFLLYMDEEKLEGNIVGMILQSIPFVQEWKNYRDNLIHTEYHNSGYSVAISTNKIIEVIRKLESSIKE